ncbi:MAG: hypothetical protein HKL86_06410 [Acidimicrobiaceae bacterium]|nr:hypothetical protein [Acidimicrobiaceae bacterium]
MDYQCGDLESCGFQRIDPDRRQGAILETDFTIALATRTYQPGVSTFISYVPCKTSDGELLIEHSLNDGSGCWHQLSAGVDRHHARQDALQVGIEALDGDLDQWEVRGQFAFADPDNQSHRWHAQRSRLRLSSLRYEIGQISRESRDFKELQGPLSQLRQRVGEAYSLLAEMTNSSLADKSDIEVTQRENLNLLLSVIAALVLAPGIVISFDSATRLTSNPLSLLLSCCASSLLAAALIISFSGFRLRLNGWIRLLPLVAVSSVAVAAVVLLAFFIHTTQRMEGLALLAATLLCIAALVTPWGRRKEVEAAPPRWNATWERIRNDGSENWNRLNAEGSRP